MLGAAPAAAQDTLAYFRHLPAASSIQTASPATTRFGLYAPTRPSGVASAALEQRLADLAERFSPILHVQNRSVPRSVLEAIDEGPHGPSLVVDRWSRDPGSGEEHHTTSVVDLAAVLSGRLARGQIPLRWGACGDPAIGRGAGGDPLAELVACHGPYGPRRPASSGDGLGTVLYFDFLGSGPAGWRQEYLGTDRVARPHVYVHPFVVEERFAANGPEASYRLILQYWFFYPFNDFINNHEGDWEHLNVHVTTASRVAGGGPRAGLLTEQEVRDILGGQLDELRIARLDYYFHHNVMVLDLVDLGVYTAGEPKVDGSRKPFLGTGWQSLAAELRARHGNGGWAGTHPVGYVAGAPLDWTLLFSLPRRQDRNSHGTYPFHGVWKRVGPAVITELVDHGKVPCTPPVGTRVAHCSDEGWLRFGTAEITTVPDWDVFFTTPCAVAHPVGCELHENGARWVWLFLPIRWGYPVTDSPGGGLIPHYNLGQASPMGPAHQAGWNRAGSVPGFDLYVAHTREQGILAPTDLTTPGAGFLNLVPFLTAFTPLPGLPLALVLGESKPRMLTPQPQAPDRAVSLTWSLAQVGRHGELQRLVPAIFGPPGIVARRRDGAWLPASGQLRYHLSRLVTGVEVSRTTLRRTAHPPAPGAEPGHAEVRADRVEGFTRWALGHGAFEPFLRLGYGWSRLTVCRNSTRDACGEGNIFAFTTGWDFLSRPDWTVGLGAELVSLRLPRRAFPVGKNGMDVGLQAEWTWRWTRIRDFGALGLAEDPGLLRSRQFDLSLTIGR